MSQGRVGGKVKVVPEVRGQQLMADEDLQWAVGAGYVCMYARMRWLLARQVQPCPVRLMNGAVCTGLL